MGRRRSRPDTVHGVVLVDKPVGPTSFDVVRRVRQALGVNKAGHTGTLDPLASGLLPVCLGQGTRLATFLTADDKRYVATLRLGVLTDTLDGEGAVTRTDPEEAVHAVRPDALEAAVARWRGVIAQQVPIYSAIKVDGERLHAKARAGEDVEAPVREVTVHALEVLSFEAPHVTFEVHASKGTYVRSLARDIGAALGLGAHLTALRRTAVGALSVDQATPLEAIEADPTAAALLSPADAMNHLPTVVLDPAAEEDVRQGRRRPFPTVPPGLCRGLDTSGRLVAILEAAGTEPGRVVRGFPLTTNHTFG